MSDDRKKAAQGTRKVDPRWTPHVIADLGEIADICREGGRDDLADELLRRLQAELPIPRSVPRADALGRDEGRG